MKLKILGITIASVLVIASISSVARGQWDDRYWRTYNKRQVEEIIKNVETSADGFRKDFDTWLDHSHFDGKEKEDKFNSKVKRFEESTDRLRKEFDRRDSWWETRNEVQRVVNEGNSISQMMRNHEFGRGVEDEWRKLRTDINKLAATYRLPLISWPGRGRR